MAETPKTLTLKDFLGDMLKTSVEVTIQYLYDNREAISHSMSAKMQEILSRREKKGDGPEAPQEDGPETPRRIEIKSDDRSGAEGAP